MAGPFETKTNERKRERKTAHGANETDFTFLIYEFQKNDKTQREFDLSSSAFYHHKFEMFLKDFEMMLLRLFWSCTVDFPLDSIYLFLFSCLVSVQCSYIVVVVFFLVAG